MDDRTRILISLSVSKAVNCIPCLEHYLSRARGLDLSNEDIHEAFDLAGKVRNGAYVATKTSLDKMMEKDVQTPGSCCDGPDRSCC